MSGYDRRFDPVTRDYVEDGRGGFELTRTAETACYHQLLGDLNAWAGDAGAGSRLHLIPRKAGERTAIAAKDAVEAALRVLVEAGAITGVEVTVTRDQFGRLSLSGSAQDVQSGELDLSPILPQGV